MADNSKETLDHAESSKEQTRMETGGYPAETASGTEDRDQSELRAAGTGADTSMLRGADYNEEYAEDTADIPERRLEPANVSDTRASEIRENQAVSDYMGWIGIILAVASLFFWPAVLGPAAVLFGFIAWSQGSRTLGVWAMVLGAISFVAFMVLIPLYF